MIADGIRKAREARGMTQADLAAAIGTDQTHVAHWESGRREPNLSNACAIASALLCSLDALVGRSTDVDAAFGRGYLACREDMKIATRTKLAANS